MNKVSDKERREVAERLRVYSHDFDFSDSDPFWYVSKTAFGDVDVHTYCSVFARLVDLIDRPAVKPIRPYDDMPDYIFCGECNTQIWNSANYCPQCGTRCVPYSKPFFDDEDRRIYETICGDV